MEALGADAMLYENMEGGHAGAAAMMHFSNIEPGLQGPRFLERFQGAGESRVPSTASSTCRDFIL